MYRKMPLYWCGNSHLVRRYCRLEYMVDTLENPFEMSLLLEFHSICLQLAWLWGYKSKSAISTHTGSLFSCHADVRFLDLWEGDTSFFPGCPGGSLPASCLCVPSIQQTPLRKAIWSSVCSAWVCEHRRETISFRDMHNLRARLKENPLWCGGLPARGFQGRFTLKRTVVTSFALNTYLSFLKFHVLLSL